MKSDTVRIDSEVLSGTPCFVGTRVPVQTFLDYVKSGEALAEFLDDFPGISRETAVRFLMEAKSDLLGDL